MKKFLLMLLVCVSCNPELSLSELTASYIVTKYDCTNKDIIQKDINTFIQSLKSMKTTRDKNKTIGSWICKLAVDQLATRLKISPVNWGCKLDPGAEIIKDVMKSRVCPKL